MSVEPVGRRERKKRVVRERIFEETLQLVARHGVEGTTVDAICDCADVAKKTFYNYYSSKNDLLADLCQTQLLDQTAAMIDRVLDSGRDLTGQLELVFGEFSRRNRDAGVLEKELLRHMVGNLSTDLHQGASQLTFLNTCFQRIYACHAGTLQPGLAPEFCAEMTVGMINALTLNWLHIDGYDILTRYRELLEYIKRSMLTDSENTLQPNSNRETC